MDDEAEFTLRVVRPIAFGLVIVVLVGEGHEYDLAAFVAGCAYLGSVIRVGMKRRERG